MNIAKVEMGSSPKGEFIHKESKPIAKQHRIVKKLDELLPLCETLKED